MSTIPFRSYETASVEVKTQIQRMTEIWTRHLQDDVLGIYLHGSMCLSCFIETQSDIDILIVTKQHVSREVRLAIAKDIMAIDRKPCPLEMSAVWIRDLQPWKHPTPCQFHYSDYWTEKYQELLTNPESDHFLLDSDFEDPDIACHVMLTRQSGVCILGSPVYEVFPPVPEEDFWGSLTNDITEYDFNAYKPCYFASNVLILGRVLSFKQEHRILSKYEGGLWTLQHIPERFRYIIQDCLEVWYEGKAPEQYQQKDLEDLRTYLISAITA